MDNIVDQVSAIIPLKYQVFFGMLGLAIKYLAEFYSSVRSGGGLRRIIMSFWFGESIPAVIAKDYAAELKTDSPAPVPEPR